MGPRLVGRGKLFDCNLSKIQVCASMGPRLVGRGKWVQWAFQNNMPELQWGRVLWDAESRRENP